MSERKVLQKYYPADFDPRNITRSRGPKQTGPRIQTVRLMAPFSMKCLTCGEFVYRGRKFNSRKVTDQSQKYLNIQIFFFHIKCTRCSAEIIFRTDPKNNDYAMVRGAMRTMEPWRSRDGGCCDGREQDKEEEETLDARLDRLEREEAEAAGESGEAANAMEELEAQNEDARREMAAADALDEIRQRNARAHRSELDGIDFAERMAHEADEERARQDAEDAAAARRAFAARILAGELPAVPVSVVEERDDEETKLVCDATAVSSTDLVDVETATTIRPSFKRTIKKKKNHSAQLGIKIKTL